MDKLERVKIMKTTQTMFNILAIIMFIIAGALISEGLDKINNYYNSENFPSLNENAYVGGDAYNFIINANYATGYYVLAMISVIAGFGFLIVGYLSQIVDLQKETKSFYGSNPKQVSDEGFQNNSSHDFSDLPEL